MKKQKQNRLVVGDASWAKDIPKWLLEEIETERMLLGLITISNPDLPKVGDAEVTAYLFTASLRAPIGHTLTEIYLYLFTKIMTKRKTKVPDDIRKEKLTPYEERELEDLRAMIYRCRGGEINHPILNAMRELKKRCDREERKIQTKSQPKTLFDL